MRVSRQTAFRIAVVVVATATYLVAPGLPPGRVFEARPAANPRPKNKHVRTIPVSDKMVTLKITGGGGHHEVEASQFEGGLIRVEKAGGSVYGLSPFVSDLSGEKMAIKVYRIGVSEADGVAGETLNEVNSLMAEKAGGYSATYADAEATFKIEIIDVRTVPGTSLESLSSPEALSECCAGCRGEMTCACRVATPCGACCSGVCCSLPN